MTGSGRWWAVACVLAAAAGVGIALWRAPRTVEVPAEEDGRPASSSPAPSTEPPRPAGPVLPAPPDLAAAPRGVDAAQWAALRAELAQRPAELKRVADYLDYSAALRDFAALPAGSAARRALAARLDAGLDERLRQREMSAGEARLVKTALLEALENDPTVRAAALERWQAAWRRETTEPAAGGLR